MRSGTHLDHCIMLYRYVYRSDKNSNAEDVPCCLELDNLLEIRRSSCLECIRIYFGENKILLQFIGLYSVSICLSGRSRVFLAAAGSILFISISSGIEKMFPRNKNEIGRSVEVGRELTNKGRQKRIIRAVKEKEERRMCINRSGVKMQGTKCSLKRELCTVKLVAMRRRA